MGSLTKSQNFTEKPVCDILVLEFTGFESQNYFERSKKKWMF